MAKGRDAIVIVVALLGGLVLLSIAGLAVIAVKVQKNIAASRIAEATSTVQQLATSAGQVYETSHGLCASASHAVPAQMSEVRGKTHVSNFGDWNVDVLTNGGFFCLHFSTYDPQHYQYDYRSTATEFTASARGDLDGDKKESTFSTTGRVTSTMLAIDPMKQTDPEE